MAGNQKVTTENIDGVILRLLKLESGKELDYQTYFKKILNRIAIDRGIVPGVKNLPAEESELLREELKRVKKLIDKGRFVVKEKKAKVSSTPPPKTGPGRPSGGGGGNNPPPKTGAIVKSPKGKLSTEKFFYQPKIEEVKVKDITEKTAKISRKNDPLDRIITRLDSIIKTLTDLNKENKKESENQRRDAERRKRKSREESLESKVFDGIKSAVKKMMAPFQSIWDYILNFLWNVFLGKVVLKLLDWFSDPKNKDKIGSIVRFFQDWWPTMLGAYILFGTSFGKLARTVVGFAIKGAIGFGKVITRLIAAIAKGKSLKVAGAFAGGRKGLGGSPKGGGGWKGALLKGGLAVGGTLLAGFAIDKGVESLMGSGDQSTDQSANIDVPDEPKIPMLNAASGGLADLGKVLGKFGGLGGMLGPLGMLMSMGMGSVPEMFQGLVNGKKGTDKIPAMLTDGEFVMSKGAVQKYGVDTLQSMNAAGGGSGIPKIVKGIPHAAEGGMIGGVGEIRKRYDTKHGEGAYDKESARRRSAANAKPLVPNTMPPVKTGNQEYLKQLRSGAVEVKPTQLTKLQKLQPPKSAIKPNINPNIGSQSPTKDSKREAEREARKKARAEYSKIINNPDDPRYQDAWDGKISVNTLKANYAINPQTTPSAKPTGMGYTPYQSRFAGARDAAHNKAKRPQLNDWRGANERRLNNQKPTGMGYTPYQSRFAGARDAAHERAKGITGGSSGFSANRFSTNLGNIFNGPRMQARQDYATSKGKYYSSSDKKTYGNYNDAKAANKSRMTSLASQQRLDKLSSSGANRSSRGKRFDAESKARGQEVKNRGGAWGQISRGWMNTFGSDKDRQNIAAQNKASQARVKQAGAESIGRYYSSSDGKYYKDKNAAVLAKKQRVKSGVKPPVKPKPKYTPAGGGMGGKRGSKGKSGNSSTGSVRPVAASRKNTGAQKRQLGINK